MVDIKEDDKTQQHEQPNVMDKVFDLPWNGFAEYPFNQNEHAPRPVKRRNRQNIKQRKVH